MDDLKIIVACSSCFHDNGLIRDAMDIGTEKEGLCPQCGSEEGYKLSKEQLERLAHRFFVWGSLRRAKYGGAPLVQFNSHRKGSELKVPSWLESDTELFVELLGIGFFYYGPRLWMLGEVEPLKALEDPASRAGIVDLILKEYPVHEMEPSEAFYRVRTCIEDPTQESQFDSPPVEMSGSGRLDTPDMPVLYGSPDLDVCVHECRVSAEDEIHVARLRPAKTLKLLNLAVLLKESRSITEFESLDMAIHMLFLAAKHAYPISRAISVAARASGFDGLIYPSYFSMLRVGAMPFQTTLGISNRRIPEYRGYEQSFAVPNLGLFGRPVEEGVVSVECINRLILRRVSYDYHFGPILPAI
ncbi:MAG: RES family NAD+ phosphorylase [Candidatus Thiodiazotropha sp.]